MPRSQTQHMRRRPVRPGVSDGRMPNGGAPGGFGIGPRRTGGTRGMAGRDARGSAERTPPGGWSIQRANGLHDKGRAREKIGAGCVNDHVLVFPIIGRERWWPQ